jgi:hypothetical protein
MAKVTSITLTTTDGVSFVIGTADIIKVLTNGTGATVIYSNKGAGRKQIDVLETPAAISTAAGTLISVTDLSSSTVFYITGDRVNAIESSTNGDGQGLAVIETAEAVAQVTTSTLTGTSGTANLTMGALVKLATFDTDLTTTAANFVTAHAAAYLANGDSIIVTSDGADLIFTAAVAGDAFVDGGSANVSGDLDGTEAATTANVEQANTWTPYDVEIGDVFYATAGGETVEFIATAATVANVTAGLKAAMDLGSAGWSTYLNGNTATDNTTNVTTAGTVSVVSASSANTSSKIKYDNYGANLESLVVSENLSELNTALQAL